MRQTLFHIPYEIGGLPLFGMGVLLLLWIVTGIGLICYQARREGLSAALAAHLPVLLLVAAGILLLPKVFPEALPIRGYGVMLVVAVTSALMLAIHRARLMGIDPDTITSLAIRMFIAGIVGARLFHVIEYWQDYRKETLAETLAAVVNVPKGGLVVYGSLIGAVAAFLWFAWRRKMPMLALADLIAPSLLLGLALGRVGCLLNGCCFGAQSQLPWAVTFPAGSPPYQDQVVRGAIALYGIGWNDDLDSAPIIKSIKPNSAAATAGLNVGDRIAGVDQFETQTTGAAQWALMQESPMDKTVAIDGSDPRSVQLPGTPIPPRSRRVHPTQVYSTINALLLCLFLLSYYPYRRRDGEVLAMMLTIYPVSRFLLEIIRTDESAIFGTGMSISQNVSLLILVGVAALWIYIRQQPRGSLLPVRA